MIEQLSEQLRKIDEDCERLGTPTFDRVLIHPEYKREFCREYYNDGKYFIPSWRRRIPVTFTSDVDTWELVGVLSLYHVEPDNTIVTARQAQYR